MYILYADLFDFEILWQSVVLYENLTYLCVMYDFSSKDYMYVIKRILEVCSVLMHILNYICSSYYM